MGTATVPQSYLPSHAVHCTGFTGSAVSAAGSEFNWVTLLVSDATFAPWPAAAAIVWLEVPPAPAAPSAPALEFCPEVGSIGATLPPLCEGDPLLESESEQPNHAAVRMQRASEEGRDMIMFGLGTGL